MKTYLTYKDDKSDKFWQIETHGNSFTVTYGKTGTTGTSQTKEFDNETTCLKEAEKLVAEKRKKGYAESAGTTARDTQKKSNPEDFKASWEALLKSNDKHSALMNHFSYLTGSQSSSENLNLILKKVTDVFISDKEELCLKLSVDNLFLVATAPNRNIDMKWPKSFQQYQEKHEFITLTDRKNIIDLTLGDTGTLPLDELAENMDSEKFASVVSPVSEMSDWWIYHPTEKSKGEPKIYLVDHEDMSTSEFTENTAGELFLKRCADIMNIPKDEKLSIYVSSRIINPIKESNALLNNTQILRLSETDVLCLGWGELSHLKITKDNIIQNQSVGIENYRTSEGQLKKSPDGKFLIWVPRSVSYIISVTNQEINIEEIITEDPNVITRTAVKSGNKLYYYYESGGFYERKLPNGSYDCYTKETHKDNLFIKDSAIIQNQLIFVGQKCVINFELSENEPPKELLKLKEKFSWPKILTINNEPFFMLFETQSDRTPAITVYEIGKKLKKLTTFRPGESALCWQFYKDDLWIVTESKKNKKRYFCLHFKWKAGNLHQERELEIDFQHNSYLFLSYLHILDNEILLINSDGIIWRFPI